MERERAKNSVVLNKENGIIWTNGKLHKIPEKVNSFRSLIPDTVHSVTALSVAVASRGRSLADKSSGTCRRMNHMLGTPFKGDLLLRARIVLNRK